MAKKQSGRSGLVIAGLGFGVAAGIAAGTLVIAPNLPGGVGGGAGMSATELEAAQQERDINAAQAESADSVVAHLADSTVRGVLEGTPVMVMSTADADSAVVDEVARLAVVAGARDAGRIKLENKFFSQDGADSLKNIIANTLPAGATLSETNRDPGITQVKPWERHFFYIRRTVLLRPVKKSALRCCRSCVTKASFPTPMELFFQRRS